MTAFHTYLREILEEAGREAQAERSTTVEAQHVLLAMASRSETETARLLESLGLNHGAIRVALDHELEHSLGAAGVSLDVSELRRAQGSPSRPPQLGTSVRYVLERGLGSLREAPQPEHVLLGVLSAGVGTLPRALELAGFDRAALLARVRHVLAAE